MKDALVTVVGATALLGALWVMYLALWLLTPVPVAAAVTKVKRVYNDARRARTAEERAELKAYAIRQVREWMGDHPVRLSLAAQYFPKGVESYPAADLLATLGRMKGRDHYVLVDGIAVPPPNETPIETLRRELWGPDPSLMSTRARTGNGSRAGAANEVE